MKFPGMAAGCLCMVTVVLHKFDDESVSRSFSCLMLVLGRVFGFGCHLSKMDCGWIVCRTVGNSRVRKAEYSRISMHCPQRESVFDYTLVWTLYQ